jgi:hypothetical protein
MAAAMIGCADAARLSRAMGRHFGHKVRVEQAGPVTRIFLTAGSLELEPGVRRLAIRASADGEDELADVKRIAENHLARFARPAQIDIAWDVADTTSRG